MSNLNGQQAGGVAGNVNGVPFTSGSPFGFFFGNSPSQSSTPNRFGDEEGGQNQQLNSPGGFFPGFFPPPYPYPAYPGFGGGGYGPYGPGFGGGFGGPGFGGPGFGGGYGPGFGGPGFGGGYGPGFGGGGYGPGFGGPGFGGGFGGPGFGGPFPFFEQNKQGQTQDDKRTQINPNHELYEDRSKVTSKPLKDENRIQIPTKRPTISTRKPEVTTVNNEKKS